MPPLFARKRALLCCLLFALAPSLAPSVAWPANAESVAPEYRLKAVFLYNFIKFVTWPSNSSPTSAIEVCVLGESPFGDELDFMQGKTIQGRTVKVSLRASIALTTNCQLLFISNSQHATLTTSIRELAARPILTVSDIDEFAAAGGMIGFTRRGDRIGLEINLDPVKAAKLAMSSKLLEVATVTASASANSK